MGADYVHIGDLSKTGAGSAPAVTPALWRLFLSGDRRACARLISKIENNPNEIHGIRERLADKLGHAIRIGVTGPPGVGKSTLCSAIALGLADRRHRVGVIAVDPSSPFTGGAFMGDRVRMEKFVGDDRIFMRSLASREGRGGLSPATPYVADVVEAFGMDRILIETVGVGQAELDVMRCADLVVLVLQPVTGDAIQSLKAGIIEAADIIVVNKSDLPGADTVLQSLRFVYSLDRAKKSQAPPLLAVSAQQTEGIEELVDTIEQLSTSIVQSGRHQELRQMRLVDEIRRGIEGELWLRYLRQSDAESAIQDAATQLAASGGSAYQFVREMCSQIQLSVDPKADA
jgi:LAO/AO transport system kinase